MEFSNKNILETFLHVGYHKLTLTRMFPSTISDNKRELVKKETMKFETIIKGLKDPLIKELTIVKELNDHEILTWFDDFEDIAVNLGWKEEEYILVLKNAITDKKCAKAMEKGSYQSIKKEILGFRYPKCLFGQSSLDLFNIKQGDYSFLQKMVEDIETRMKVISFLENYTKSEYLRKYNEIYLNALSTNTKDFIMKQGLVTVEEISKKLLELERELVERIKKDLSSAATQKNDNSYAYRKRDAKKWCSYHRSKTHSSEDCYFLKTKAKFSNNEKTIGSRKKENYTPDNKNINSSCNSILHEQTVYQPVKIFISIDGKSVEALIDTGCTRNLINKIEADRLKLAVEKDARINFVFGNGEKCDTDTVVETEIRVNDLGIIHKCVFYVVEKLSTKCILGQEFLHENNIILNFLNCTIGNNFKRISMFKNVNDLDTTKDFLLERCFNIDEELVNIENKRLIQDYMKQNNFYKSMKIKDVFIKQVKDEPHTKFNYKAYTIPRKYIQATKNEIKRLIEEDIIEYSDSVIYSPAFVILKKNKEVRLVVDFREINKGIADEIDLIPNIRQLLTEIKGSKIFSKIDLKNGFNQVPIDTKSAEITTFKILGNIYKYKRIPFGIKSGPKIFQKIMNRILAGINNVVVYIDDILIYANSNEEHNRVLREVLLRLKEHEIKINFQKSTFGAKEIEMLGVFINENDVRPNLNSINKLISKLDINKRRDLQRILGVLNWYREFLPDFSNKISKLTDKLKGLEANIKLSNEEKTQILKIIYEIKENGSLKNPKYDDEFCLQTDASDKGIGAVLFQKHGILGYYSKKLSPIEQNYTIVEKEMLAIIKSLEFFKGIIVGYRIKIMCDNRNCLFKNKNNNSRMLRWQLMLNDFNCELVRIEGKRNIVADYLSRKEEKENCLVIRDHNLDRKGRICIKPEESLEFVRKMHLLGRHVGMHVLYNR